MKKIFCLLLLFLSFVACDEDDSSEVPITISRVWWSYNNVDPKYTSNNVPVDPSGMNYTLEYDGEIESSDITKIVLSGENVSWTKENTYDDFIDTENKILLAGNEHFYITDTPYLSPISTMTFDIYFSNGAVLTHTFDPPEPGDLNSNGNTYLYTEDFTGTPESSWVKHLQRAELTSAAKTGSDITISFKVDDSRVFSGWIWFYDSDKDYIGYSKVFRNYETQEITSITNSGSALYTNGTENQISISETDVTVEYGSYSDIAYFGIILTDGYQYVTDPEINSWDCSSRAGYLSF